MKIFTVKTLVLVASLFFLSAPNAYSQICNGDFDCDNDVDGTDAVKFKADFFRKDCLDCVCREGSTIVCGTDVGECEFGTRTCTNDEYGDCVGGVTPISEICDDGMDNDCDGKIDCVDTGCDGQVGGTTGELCEFGTELTCDDAFDNDGDDATDDDDTADCEKGWLEPCTYTAQCATDMCCCAYDNACRYHLNCTSGVVSYCLP